MLIIAGIMILDYFDVVSLRLYSALLFNLFLENILFLIIPVAGLFMIYRINFLFFHENLYLDKIAVRKPKEQSFGGRFNYLENFGETGEYLSLELKMLLRNKRTKSSFVMALMMLVVGPFFYFSMSDFWDPYPQPNQYTEILNESEVNILFKINPDTIPANATVYITGNHEKLGDWGRGIGFIPLEMNKDGIWQRTISFPPKTELKYKFTLGTWKNERLDPDGSIPDAYVHEVESDTALVYQATGWNVPRQFIFVDIMIVYMGLIFVGILMLIYGQFMLAWESNYFDFLLSRKIDFAKYFLAKYILLLVFGILMFLITTPIVFISKELLYVNAILTVYCLGVNSFVMFIMAGFTRKRLDLNASIFSTQGKGANQFTLIIPTMIIPLLIFVPFVVFDHRIEGYLFLLILGVLGLLFFRPLLQFCIRFFYKQKYKISSGFRQSRG